MHGWDDKHTEPVLSFLNRDGDFFTSDRQKLLLSFLMPPKTSQNDVAISEVMVVVSVVAMALRLV